MKINDILYIEDLCKDIVYKPFDFENENEWYYEERDIEYEILKEESEKLFKKRR